jgi:PAS domain S-box-containing protein
VSAERILVVEDEALVALDLEERLVRLGYHVVGRETSGLEAVAAAERTDPELVLMDIQLGGTLDGIDAAARIRQATGASILYLTAHADERTVSRAAATEPVGYLVKPIEDRQLRSALEVGLGRRRLERELREREERFASILESIADGLIATDAAWRVTFANPMAERLTGIPRDEALGKPLAEVYRVVDPAASAVNPVTRTMTPRASDVPAPHAMLVARDGTTRTVDDRAAWVRDASGEPAGVVLVFRDVGERQRVEAALRRSTALRAAIMEAALDCILITDPPGRVVAANRAAERLLGRSTGSLLGTSVLDVFAPAVRDELRKNLAQCVASGQAPLLGRHVVSSAVRGDGRRIPIEFALISLRIGGPEHFALFLRALGPESA